MIRKGSECEKRRRQMDYIKFMCNNDNYNDCIDNIDILLWSGASSGTGSARSAATTAPTASSADTAGAWRSA